VQIATDITGAELCAGLQAAGAEDESGHKLAKTNDSQPMPSVTLRDTLQSLDNVCAHMETAGCAFYEQLYNLIDQVYVAGRQQVVQKMTKDSFQTQ